MRSSQEIIEASKVFPSPDFRSNNMMAAAVSEGIYVLNVEILTRCFINGESLGNNAAS